MNEEELESRSVHCPYCDAHFDLLVDLTQGSHATWEDCPHCCAPIQVIVTVPAWPDEPATVTLGRDDDVL